MGKLARNAAIYGLGGAINKLIGFLLLPLFTHLITPREYGIAALLQMISFVVVPVFSFGFSASLAPVYYREAGLAGRRRVVMSAVTFLLASTVALLLLSVLLADTIAAAWLGGAGSRTYFLISMSTAAAMVVASPLSLYLQFENRARAFVIISMGSTLLTALLSIAAVAWWKLGLEGWLGAILVGQLVNLAGLVVVFVGGGVPRPGPSYMRQLVLMGLPFVPSFAMLWVIQQGNRIALENTHGLGQLGIYSVGSSFGMAIGIILVAFQRAWLPFFMEHRDDPGAAGLFSKVTNRYCIGFGLLVVAAFAFAAPVVQTIVAAEFRDAYLVVGTVALSQLLMIASSLLTPPQYFSEKLYHITIIQVIGACVSVPVNYYLIRALGLPGAGLALATCYGLLGLIHLLWNRIHTSYPIRLAFDRPRLLLVGAAYTALSAVAFFHRPEGLAWQLLSAVSISAAAAMCAFVALGREERGRFVSVMNRMCRPGVSRPRPS